MESVLLGLAAPAAAGSAGNLLEGTLRTAAAPFAALLHGLTSVISPEGEDSAAVATDGLQGTLKSLQSELTSGIEGALRSAGVNLNEPITIRISEGDGQLEVVGDHPQKALIEAALADNPDLAVKFTEVAAIRQLLAEVDRLDASDMAQEAALGEAGQDTITGVFTVNDDGAKIEFK